MVECIRCESTRILSISGKTSDLFDARAMHTNKIYDGYVIRNIGIGGGDYVTFSYCLDCGQIQGNFPVPTNDELESNIPYQQGSIVDESF